MTGQEMIRKVILISRITSNKLMEIKLTKWFINT